MEKKTLLEFSQLQYDLASLWRNRIQFLYFDTDNGAGRREWLSLIQWTIFYKKDFTQSLSKVNLLALKIVCCCEHQSVCKYSLGITPASILENFVENVSYCHANLVHTESGIQFKAKKFNLDVYSLLTTSISVFSFCLLNAQYWTEQPDEKRKPKCSLKT